MPTQNVDVGEAVRLIDRMTALTNEKLKLLIELRASVLHHFHADPNDFPRPMSVLPYDRCHVAIGSQRCTRHAGHGGAHKYA